MLSSSKYGCCYRRKGHGGDIPPRSRSCINYSRIERTSLNQEQHLRTLYHKARRAVYNQNSWLDVFDYYIQNEAHFNGVRFQNIKEDRKLMPAMFVDGKKYGNLK